MIKVEYIVRMAQFFLIISGCNEAMALQLLNQYIARKISAYWIGRSAFSAARTGAEWLFGPLGDITTVRDYLCTS